MDLNICIIGGAAIDITGSPTGIFRLRDSNIGSVLLRVGGVGHNIAKRLKRYNGVAVELITALGSDSRTAMIEHDCAGLGISIDNALRIAGDAAAYLSILDDEGDMLAGINDMQIIEKLAPDFLKTKLPLINAADMCVLDANLSPEALSFLTEHVTAPIFYEPVSCAKARRIGDGIGKCYAVKPNRYEAALLSGFNCDTIGGVSRAADWFLQKGVKRVFISLGNEGVYYADAADCGQIATEPIRVVDTTGAGDAMAAAVIFGSIYGESVKDCATRGNHESALLCAQLNQED